jgi:CheY-like chemotaxis protein
MAYEDWVVLVVEDEHDSVQMLSEIMAHHHIAVAVARNGHDCLKMLATLRPTLVIMDLAMPGLDGWQTLKSIRANPATADLPVVAITAYHSTAVGRDALAAGFNGYFSKPLNALTFIDSLAALV